EKWTAFAETESAIRMVSAKIRAIRDLITLPFPQEIILTSSGRDLQDRLAPSSLGVSPKELHLTCFPQGNPRANGSLAQLKILSMKTSSGRFLQTSSRNFRRRIMKER